MENTWQHFTATALLSSVAAIVLLITFSPILLILILLIKQDGGPVLYVQDRVGKDGKIFKCFKFRTMHVDADRKLPELLQTLTREELTHWQETRKLSSDPRLTKIGTFLRKFSVDELPQIVNIARGDMTFFGPRPIPRKELDVMCGRHAMYYMMCKPGLSGLAQINAFGKTPPLLYRRRVALDRYYATRRTLLLDCRIALSTLAILWRVKNY